MIVYALKMDAAALCRELTGFSSQLHHVLRLPRLYRILGTAALELRPYEFVREVKG